MKLQNATNNSPFFIAFQHKKAYLSVKIQYIDTSRFYLFFTLTKTNYYFKKMTQFTLTRDLWDVAERQVNKIRPQKGIPIRNDFDILTESHKSMDSIFDRSQKTISTIMRPGSTKVVKLSQNVPSSVKVLDSYAQKIGFLPMGQIYENIGNKYIGRVQQITQKGEIFYKSFPDFDQTFLDTPNLTQNFSFRANKAINKWNQFVSAEAQLASYLGKIQTQQGRKKMVQQYSKTSSVGSDQLKILSSLYYYYMDPKSSNLNYLNLDESSEAALKKNLNKVGLIGDIYSQILSGLLIAKQKDMKKLQKIQHYHHYKLLSLKASLKPQQFSQIQPLLSDKKAYVPDEMISIPMQKDSQWYKYIQNDKQWGSKLIITDWNPKLDWIKLVNYLS